MDTPINTSDAQVNSSEEVSKSKLEKISFIVLLITIIFVPLAFIPTAYAPIDMTKTLVVTAGILVSSILYFLSIFKSRKISIPKHPLVTVGAALVVSILVSAVLSANFEKAFFGQVFELGTASFILVLFLGGLLTAIFAEKDKDRIVYVYGALILSFAVLILFHLVRIFAGVDFMDFGIFQALTSTMIGKWNDLAIFAAIIGIIAYTSIQFLVLRGAFKVLLSILAIISLLLVFLANSPVIWLAVAIVTAGMALYQYSLASKERGFFGRLPILTIIVTVVALACMWKGSVIAVPVIQKMNLQNVEIGLPWQLSLDVMTGTLKESPFFGAGPNGFTTQYLQYKPQGINSTQFWNAEFNNAFGLIPTFMVTQGLVGVALWIAFIIIFIIGGVRFLKTAHDSHTRFFGGSTFFAAGFVWIIAFLYTPSHSVIFTAFILTGLLLASLSSESYRPSRKLAPALILIALIVSAGWLGLYAKKVVALGYFQGGINSLNVSPEQGIDQAEQNFKRALALDKSDIYYQALSEINILKISALAQQIQSQVQQGATADQATVERIGALVEEGLQYTRSAIALDPENYYNYVAEARISEVALSLKIENSYETVKAAYTNAINHNPFNPGLYLSLARLEVSQNNLDEALRLIGLALQLKPNYTEAIFLLSQIQVSQGQLKDAITSVEVTTQINPNNPLLFFQLGLLHYNDKNYRGATEALTKAVELDNQYANARYFLGLSHARLGNIAEAIEQFDNLASTNPESQEVSLILSNLRAGKSPFADAEPPLNTAPEQRKNLPLEENASKKSTE